ncbi:flippase [Psychromonas sp. L1A2]|uniref:flippase n=1 Tax=Psychromonas sp. L1A2 TaxID=2686356 RepID=UPI00135A35BB|nr:flippase [Psychromonas sp. L1A2]
MILLAKLKRLKQNKGFMKYFKNTSWLFAEKILRVFVGIFIGIWIARYLGPEQFGLLSYAQSFAALFTVFATLGLDQIVIRELIKDESARDKLLGTAFILKLFGAFAVLIAIACTALSGVNTSAASFLILIIASSTVFQSFNVVDFYFQSKVMSKFVAFANVISLAVSSLIKVTLLLNESSLITFALVSLFDAFILAGGYIYFYLQNNLKIIKWSFDGVLAKALLKDSWPLILTGVVISVYMKIDQIMIGDMLGNKAVGEYAAAVKLSEPWYFIPTIIASSVFPSIINTKKNSEKAYYERLQKLYNLVVKIALVIAITITFLSDWIINLLYGSEFSQASSVLSIHIWAGVFAFLGIASRKWFIAENLSMLSFWRTFFGMVINIVMNILLIPCYGIQGAAVAILLSQISVAYIFDFLCHQTRAKFFMKTKALLLISGK